MEVGVSAGQVVDQPTLGALEAVIAARRTNLRMDPDAPVPAALIERLCALAMWAPNHKRTWPWRFAALTGDARARLGALTAEGLAAGGAEEAKVAKARVKYLRAPVILAVGCSGESRADEERFGEDRDAVSAGVQNILLGCTAAGLASYWGTGAVTRLESVKKLCRFSPEDLIVALLYIGWPIGEVPIPQRPPVSLATIS